MTNEIRISGVTKPLEILIVEDNPIHQEAARILLPNHNLEIVANYDDAMDRINGPSCYAMRRNTSGKKHYDVVLTDMFLPQGRGDCTGNQSDPSIEQPFGYAIAQTACLNGISYVGIVSDANHHTNSIAFSMDPLNMSVMNVNNSRYCVFNSPHHIWQELVLKTDGTVTTVPYATRRTIRDKLTLTEKGISEIDGFVVEWDEKPGKIPGNRLKKLDRNLIPKTPERSKDWLSALIYLMTAN